MLLLKELFRPLRTLLSASMRTFLTRLSQPSLLRVGILLFLFCFLLLWPLRLSLPSGIAAVFAQIAIRSGPHQIFTPKLFVCRRPFYPLLII